MVEIAEQQATDAEFRIFLSLGGCNGYPKKAGNETINPNDADSPHAPRYMNRVRS